ncbi:hypothetical protein GQ44DRAFT_701444 [Phaeosphaeriaceae sp. PMI808]|nr:hypothetical protein GQ44DRAFT_701444 [Phaeosphaeriaceae sp. PMI808]
MIWWRRDPSQYSRFAVRHCERIVHDHEAALRNRCFSRASPKLAQHDEDGKRKRPTNISNLEWMQLQHYENWRKRWQQEPYKMLFGASNDMLNGKGLNNWEWVYKTFPKWMLKEIHINGQRQEESRDNTAQAKHSKKPEIVNQHSETLKTHEPLFPQPSFRTTRFERGEFSGIISPSDPRRPRVHKHIDMVAKTSSDIPAKEMTTTCETSSIDKSTVFAPPTLELPPKYPTVEQIMKQSNVAQIRIRDTEKEAALSGSSSAEKSSINASKHRDTSTETEGKGTVWRHTALENRAARPVTNDRTQPPLISTSSNDVLELGNTVTTSSSQEFSDSLIHINTKEAECGGDTASPPFNAHVINQPLKDDMDFLTASEIRASMGTRRSRIPVNTQRKAERQDLEIAFENASQIPSIDEAIKARIINDQHVRRKEREIRNAQVAQETTKVPLEPPTEALMESSIDRMKKWLETTGATFAKQFWQDPTDDEDVTNTRLFFDKAALYLKKGQTTTRQISEDLAKDIPASKELLKRLKSDEETLDFAIHHLRQRSLHGTAQGLTPKKLRNIAIKYRFTDTNSELEKAYGGLRELANTDCAVNATDSFKQRLATSSKVFYKNAQLLRMLIWSVQARLEDPKADRNILLNYKVVVDSLLSLRDTQMNLVRLVDQAMLIYGVVPISTGEVDAKDGISKSGAFAGGEQFAYETCDEPFIRARLAADAHLINEIKSPRQNIQGLTEKGDSRAPESTFRADRYEPSPLAHSRFRPFGPVFEKLSNEQVTDVTTEEIKDDEKKILSDLRLVTEAKNASEDTYETKPKAPIPAAPESKETKPTGEEEERESDFLNVNSAAIALDPVVQTAQKSEADRLKGTETSEAATSNVIVRSTNEDEWSSPKGLSLNSKSNLNPEAEISKTIAPKSQVAYLPTHYTILVRDPQTNTISMTVSSMGPPRDTSPIMPLHQAISILESPASFIPFITEGLEVVSAKKDILVLRDALDLAASTRPFKTVTKPSPIIPNEDLGDWRRAVNPIDGTARLSPTGYVGPDESPEQLEREFEERRQAAESLNSREKLDEEKRPEEPKRRRRGGAGSVLKTAIWVGGICYIVGVMGEIATAPL